MEYVCIGGGFPRFALEDVISMGVWLLCVRGSLFPLDVDIAQF